MVSRNKRDNPPLAQDPILTASLLERYEEQARACAQIDPQLYRKYNVKRGLRKMPRKKKVLAHIFCQNY